MNEILKKISDIGIVPVVVLDDVHGASLHRVNGPTEKGVEKIKTIRSVDIEVD